MGDSFQAKTGWERPRKRKKKIIVPINSYPTRNKKFQKNNKKILKIKKHYKGISSNQNRLGKTEKEKK